MCWARTRRSNTAGRRVNTIDYRCWRSSGNRCDQWYPERTGCQGYHYHDPHRVRRRQRPHCGRLVTSLSRPTGNVTGVTFYTAQLGGPRLGLLRELVPNATTIAILMNPDNAASVSDALGAEAAAQAIGQPTMRLKASIEGHIDDAFRS